MTRFGHVCPIPCLAAMTDRLESWKEIATYLNRSVRTVRRWEADEGLPVRRQMHRSLGSVYALKSELDAWRQANQLRRRETPSPDAHGAVTSVAVLPFASLSSDPENDYFADGLTDEIIADLSKVGALRVISRTSSMLLKGSGKDVKTIGRELGVRFIVEGTVRRASSRLRISAQLIDASTDSHVWAEKYEGTVEDVFAMQEQLARAIVDALHVRLTAQEYKSLATRPVANLHAYECYLQARQEALRWREDAIDHAVQLLHNGLAIVGENAELYAALGRAYLQYREAGIDFSQRPLREAEICVRKALATDPHSASVLQLRGWIEYSSGRIQEAVNDLKTARQVDPSDPDTLGLLSNCYLISGRVSFARPLIPLLLAADPLTPLTSCLPGFADLMEGKVESALAPYRRMFEMDPGNPMGRLFYGGLLALNGRSNELTELAESIPPQVSDTIAARLTRFLSYAAVRDRDAAMAVLTPDIEVAANATDVFPRFLAHGFAAAGMNDRAVHWLSIAVDRGFINYPFLAQHDPLLEPLRSDSRFRQLLVTVRERWQKFEP